MNSKILIKDYAGLIEYNLGKDNLTPTTNILEASVVINPKFGSLIHKSIIINLPIDIPIDKLKLFNNITSRFYINDFIKVESYDLPETRTSIKKEDYSLLILNKYMMTDPSKVDLINNNYFLLGTNTIIDGNITAIGYELLKTKLEDI